MGILGTTSSPRSIRVVLNGKSATEPTIREAVAKLRRHEHQVDVRVTWEGGQAAEYAEQAARENCDLVIAAGGDGTVNEVASGVLKAGEASTTSIGIVPLGTANDFATGCGIFGGPGETLLLATELEARLIDVGTVNGKVFINVASAGFGAEITSQTPTGIKSMLGGAAYSLVGLLKAFTMTPHTGRLVLPDEVIEGTMTMMGIGNGRLAGGGFQVAPRALLDDGLLDLVVVPDVTLAETGSLVTEMVRLGTDEPQRVIYRQLASFEIQSDHEMQMNLDGEPIREHVFQVAVLPRRLRFCLPKEAPLMAEK